MGAASGGSKSTQKNLPQWYEQDMQQGLGFAGDVASLPFAPRYGPDVAAFSPSTTAAFDNTNQALDAFGMQSGAGQSYMPETQTFAGGVQGYSSGGLYDQMIDEFEQRRPGQAEMMNSMFIDPITGEPGANQVTMQPVKYEMTAKRGK